MKLRGNIVLKKIDRIVGIPIVRLLSLMHKKRDLPQEIKTVALLLTPAIGDTILTQTLLRDIKQKSPNIQITLFLPSGIFTTAQLIGYSDRIVPISYSNIFAGIRKIRESEFDVFIDTGQWTRLSAIFTFFSRALHTRGFNTEGQYRHYAYDDAVLHDNTVHEIINIKKLQWGTYSETENFPSIPFQQSARKNSHQAVIHIKPGGVKSFLKEWGKSNWISVVHYLHAKGFEVFFTGAASDSESIKEIIHEAGTEKVFNASGKNIEETAELIRNSFLMISVNTGIMHVAAATGTNLIALHGPTNSKRWGPLSENAIIIDSPFHAAPCLNLGFEYNCKDGTGECMKAITLKMVIDAIDSIIGAGK